MVKTYKKTLFTRKEAKVKLYIYEGNKYEGNFGEEKVVFYTGLESWSIIDGEDAKQIEQETDNSCIDENHEYLVLNFVDGSTSTFRNSHVDMFIR